MDAAATGQIEKAPNDTPCKTTDANTVLAQFEAFLEAKRQAATDKRASKTDCGKKGAKDALKSILTIDFEGRDIRILTTKELSRCLQKSLDNYRKLIKDSVERDHKLEKIIKHLEQPKTLENLMLAINCFQESQAHCDEYVEEAVVEMTAEEIAKADKVEIMEGKRERKQVQRDDMVELEVEDEDEFQLVQCDCKSWRRVHKHVLEELPTKVFRVCDVCEMMHGVTVPAGEEVEGAFKCGDADARCYESPERGSEAAHQLYGNGAWRDEDHSPVGFSCLTIGLTCGKSVTCICCGQHMELNDIERQYYFQGEMNDNGKFTHEPGDWQHAHFGQQCPLVEADGDYKPVVSEDESEEEYQDSESEEEYEESDHETDETDDETDDETVEIIECEAPVSEKKYDGVIEEPHYDEYGVILSPSNKRKREELPEATVISDAEESNDEAVEVPHEVAPKKQKVETDEQLIVVFDKPMHEYTIDDFDTLLDDSDVYA